MPAKPPVAPREPQLPPGEEEPSGPRVSAILVAYNQAAELRRAIEALQRSRPLDPAGAAARLEIVIVDCGSQDDGPALDAEFPTVQILRLPQHFGATRAMNIAIRTAKAELLLFLSPLVEVLPDTVTGLAGRLEEDAGTAAVCPLLMDPSGQPVAEAYRIPSSEDFAAGTLRAMSVDAAAEWVAVEYASRSALLVRKQFLRGMNYLDERFGEHWADLDLAMQIGRAGKKIRVIPSLRATIHAGEDPLEGDAVAEADRIVGAAAFLGKYYGFFAGFKFRLGALLKALLALDFKRLSMLLSGENMGSQAGR